LTYVADRRFTDGPGPSRFVPARPPFLAFFVGSPWVVATSERNQLAQAEAGSVLP